MAQTERTVIVVSTAANKAKKITTTASNWGQLKAQDGIAEFVSGNVEAVVSPGNVTLGRDDSALPDGDFKLFLVPTKNKAGNISEEDAKDLGVQISEAILKASNQRNTRNAKDLKEDLIDVIEDFFDVDLSDDAEDCPECDDAIEEGKKFFRG